MKKYIQPAICVFEIKMESALLGSSTLQEISTSTDKVETEEYTNRQDWQRFDWTEE